MSTVGKHTQPVSGFSPLSFGGCVLWLDATSPSNFALSGSNITAWYDRSPLANHADRPSNGFAVLSNAAINGRPAVYFSNAPSIDGSMNLTTAGVTGFLVVRPLQVGTSRGDQRMFSAAAPGAADWNDTGRFLIGPQGGTTEIRFNRGNASIPRANFNASNTYVVSWTYNGASNSLYMNGADADVAQDVALSSTPFAVSTYALGDQVTATSETYNGFIGEVIVYNDFLQPAQRRAVEGYLAWKWGIAPALGTTFSPLTSLSNCAIWFDGADASAFTLSGSNITTWRDKAGSNATSNIGTPVYTSNAVNGVQGVLLDVNAGFQISPMSNAANTTTVSIYGVVTASSNAQNNARIFTVGRISDGTTNNDFNSSHLWTLFRGGDGTFYFQHAGSGVNAGTSYLSPGTPCLISVVFSGTTASLWANGSNAGSINTTNTLNFNRIGIGKNINPNAGSSYDAFAGTIGEFLIFYAAHTEAQRLQVESYLASKWNVSMRAPPHLVPTHSYTTRQPFLRDFLPTDVPGCMIWLDAADPSSVSLSSGSNVSTWRDKSGLGYTFSTVSGTPPTYASNIATFPTGAIMRSAASISLTGNTYVFVATKLNTGGCMLLAFDNIQPAATVGDFSIGYFSDILSAVNSSDFASSYTINGTSNAVFGSNTYLARHIVAGRSQASGTTTVTLSSSFSGRSFQGEIYEVLFYSNVPSTSDRLRIESYLAGKWGLRGVMGGPAHLYRYGPWMGPPITLSNCTLWLDAADTSTLTRSGSNVSVWADKSGIGNHYVQATTSKQPIYTTDSVYGRSGLAFNGTSTFLSPSNTGLAPISNSSTFSIFTVHRVNSNTFVNTVYRGSTGRHWLRWQGTFANFLADRDPEGYINFASNAVNAMNGVSSFVNDATTSYGYINGTIVGSGSKTSSAVTVSFTLGAAGDGAEVLNGSIFEVLIYNRAVTSTERQQIEGYLAWKWGLQSNLPGSGSNFAALARTLSVDFDPRSIGSCGAWFDAADPTTIQFSSGSNLSRWLDKSGLQNHAATIAGTPTYTANTLNGRSVVTFTGSQNMRSPYAVATSTTPQTMIAVVRPSALNSWMTPVVIGTTASGTPPARTGITTTSYSSYGWFLGATWGGYDGAYATVASTTRTDIVVCTWYGGSNGNTSVNGTQGADSTSTTPALHTKSAGGVLTVGASIDNATNLTWNAFKGYIAEVLVYGKALSVAERQRIEGYLAWKWGLQSQLPALHPYVATKF